MYSKKKKINQSPKLKVILDRDEKLLQVQILAICKLKAMSKILAKKKLHIK